MELLVRFNADRTFAGAHTKDANGYPTGLTEAQLPAAIGAANVAAMARVTALEGELATVRAEHEAATTALNAEHEAALKLQADVLAALQAEYADFKARGTFAAETARAIISNPNINDADSLVQIDGIAAAMLADKKARDIAAADKAAADAAAYAAALRAA